MLRYLTAPEAAAERGISRQRMAWFCKAGRVRGAWFDWECRQWMIPAPVVIHPRKNGRPRKSEQSQKTP